MVDPAETNKERNLLRSIAMAIDIAAQRAADDDAGAIEIIFSRMPSHDALVNLREIAELSGVTLAIGADHITVSPARR